MDSSMTWLVFFVLGVVLFEKKYRHNNGRIIELEGKIKVLEGIVNSKK
ncbi:MAG: hypothetical protein AB8E15_05950 [Bdellovibrionales bacterium]